MITESDDGIERWIGDCPYNFNSPLMTGQASAILIVEAEEAQVLVFIEVGQLQRLSQQECTEKPSNPTPTAMTYQG